MKVMYCNEGALAVFSYPDRPGTGKTVQTALTERMHEVFNEQALSENLPLVIMSGRRRYICRSFSLGVSFNGQSKPSTAITIERDRQPLYDLEVRFQLTERERQAVEHLAEGLTSKEIAQRMNISPNTVKTFLRLVMIKMGVTTRCGVIGKIIEAAR
jgi:DNA-binding CsgD family transcriptional regulator